MLVALSIASHAEAPLVNHDAEPGKPVEGEPNYDLEVLYDEALFDEGIAATKARMVERPDDTDLYWFLIRFMFAKGEIMDPDDKSFDRMAWYEEMVRLAEEGMAKKPDDPHMQFALGIAKGRLGTTRGVMSSLFMAQDVENAWLDSANAKDYYYVSLGGQEELPCDAYLSLAIYYRLVPESWLVQQIAGTRGDIGKSVEWIKKADQCSPGKIHVMKEAGASLLCYGQRRDDVAATKEGIQYLTKATGVPPVESTDRIDIKHSLMMISDPTMACGYSRDGQEEQDEKLLAKQAEKQKQQQQP